MDVGTSATDNSDEGPVTGSGGGGICQTMAIMYSKLIIINRKATIICAIVFCKDR